MLLTRSYGLLARIYDLLADVYSGGAIERCKRAHFTSIPEGSSVLFLGAGRGRDAAHACQLGYRVTVVECDPTMLRALRRQLGDQATIVEADIRHWSPKEPFDACVANFFLNVFTEAELEPILERLRAWTAPSGHLIVGDFAPIAGRLPMAALQRLYFLLPLIIFAWLTRNAWRGPADYGALLEARGWSLRSIRRQRLYRVGPAWFTSWLATP